MSTLANNEDPDEMPHFAAFHLGLHCLLRYVVFLSKTLYPLLSTGSSQEDLS